MNRERTLTVLAALVGLIMIGLISHTTINGRTFGPPESQQGDETGAVAMERELRRVAYRQSRFHEANGRFAVDLDELLYSPRGGRVKVFIQAADFQGWTAIATAPETQVACLVSFGTGPAANLSRDSLVEAGHTAFQHARSCGEAREEAALAVLDEFPGR